MDSAFIHQAANELVQNAGTRNIKQIARSCSLDISETSRIKDMLGLLSLYFDKPLILINRQLDKQTKQMVCGYALGHYLEHQLLMDLHTLNKFLTIKDKHILLYEHNAFTSHLMLDSDEVYQMTKRGLDAAQIATAKRIIFFYSSTSFIAQQQACIQIAVTIYTQACPRTSLFCFLLYQLSLWWVKYRAQPEAINP